VCVWKSGGADWRRRLTAKASGGADWRRRLTAKASEREPTKVGAEAEAEAKAQAEAGPLGVYE